LRWPRIELFFKLKSFIQIIPRFNLQGKDKTKQKKHQQKQRKKIMGTKMMQKTKQKKNKNNK